MHSYIEYIHKNVFQVAIFKTGTWFYIGYLLVG